MNSDIRSSGFGHEYKTKSKGEERSIMCIAGFVWLAHPTYPFLLLLNRDEFHDRPTMPVSWWDDCEIILGGRDEVAGGTWLACSKQGRLAFLTNVLEPPPPPEARSRGDLVVRFLKSMKSPMEFAQEVVNEADQYNGFNLILTDLCSKTMVYVSNRPKGEACVQEVSPGIHVLSNAKLDAPWHKVERLRQSFEESLDKCGGGEVPIKLLVEKLMSDTLKADKSKLPKICEFEWEYKSSSIFFEIDTPKGRYGTRSTSAVAVKASGEVSFYEKYLTEVGWQDHTVNYQIEDA